MSRTCFGQFKKLSIYDNSRAIHTGMQIVNFFYFVFSQKVVMLCGVNELKLIISKTVIRLKWPFR